MDYLNFYHLEAYLFGEVTQRFQEQGFLDAFDLFCIIIWKAERAKTMAAKRLIEQSGMKDLEQATRQLTEGIAGQDDARERLKYVWGSWGFRLPTACAILTVLYPGEFTMYDRRVCGQLTEYDNFYRLDWLSNFDNLWEGYQKFIAAVKQETPNGISLRNKDRWLLGRSFHDQLKGDIARGYEKKRDDE